MFSALTDVPRTRSVIGQPMSRGEAELRVAAAVDLILNGLEPPRRAKRAKKSS